MRAIKGLVEFSTGALLTLSLLVLIALGIGPRTGRYQTLSVLTGSMNPSIPPGSLVVVVPRPPQSLRAGDVITYQSPIEDRRVVTHRIAKIWEPGGHPVVATKGDANSDLDPWTARITGERVWVPILVVPHAGRVIGFMRRSQSRAVSVFAVPLLLALVWLADIWRPRKPALTVVRG